MITTADIAVALGRDQPQVGSAERLQWDMWIRDARMEISAGPNGSATIDLESLDQGRLDRVVRDAVAAKVRRPDDATQVDISVDDGRVSKIYQSSTGTVHIRPEWWRFLGLAATATAFSTRPGFEPDQVHP